MTRTHKNAILIFGTFNPITYAHVNLGLQSRKVVDDSDVIFIPAKDEFLRSWKGYGSESILDSRVSLLKSVAAEYDFLVSEIEVDGTVDGRSINTINYIKSHYEYEKVYFCMGTDKVPELEKWYKASELVSENEFLVFTRGETLESVMRDFTRQYADRFHEVPEDDRFADMSSTKVREALKNNDIESVRNMVPQKVYEYLSEER